MISITIMRFFAASILSIVSLCQLCGSSEVKSVDWDFAKHIIRTYFCTGNHDWWSKIENDPALKFIMHVGVKFYCDLGVSNEEIREDVAELLKEAPLAVHKRSKKERNDVSVCL